MVKKINLKKLNFLFLIIFALLNCSFELHAWEPLDTCGSNQYVSWSNPKGVTWLLNQNGSRDLSINQVEQIMKDSFAAWEAPCCASITFEYLGKTNAKADVFDSKNTLSFEEYNWSPEYGSEWSTIAITPLQYYPSTCSITEADILFNGAGFTFSERGGYDDTDLQSIATHEMGHFLGLDHSPYQDSTMYAAYEGGIECRTLHSDDENGVCSIYPAECCSTSDDCTAPDEICDNGNCIVRPCRNNSECATGLICVNGQCRSTMCYSNEDCGAGYICDDSGNCVNDPNYCDVCKSCTSNNDCGPDSFCANINGLPRVCTKNCSSAACPRGSECITFKSSNSTNKLCFNRESAAGVFCLNGLSCTPYSQGSNTECKTCTDCSNNGSCPDNTTCIYLGNGFKKCITFCINGECPGNSVCDKRVFKTGYIETEAEICLNSNFNEIGDCPDNYICNESNTNDSCGSVICEEAHTHCVEGSCIPDGTCENDSHCQNGYYCNENNCIKTENNNCPEGQDCSNASCTDKNDCPENHKCINEKCKFDEGLCSQNPECTSSNVTSDSNGGSGCQCSSTLFTSSIAPNTFIYFIRASLFFMLIFLIIRIRKKFW